MADDLDFTCTPAKVFSLPRVQLPQVTQETLSCIRRQLDTGNTWGSIDASARRILAVYVPQPIIERGSPWVLAALRELRSEMNGDTDFAAEMVYAAEHDRYHGIV